MPGTPPTTPVHGAPRVSNSDTFDMARDVNGVADRFDITAMRLDTGLASARPGTGPGTGAWYYATDTRQLSRWNGSAWETNLPNAHAASHQDGGTDALTVREAMMATGATGPAKGSFSAFRSTNPATSVGPTVIVFDTDSGTSAVWDVSNWYDTATGRFTPQVPGIYRLNAAAQFNAITGASQALDIYKNGAVAARLGSDGFVASIGLALNGTAEVQANGTTDFFDVRWTGSAANAPLGGAHLTYFQGHLIGRP